MVAFSASINLLIKVFLEKNVFVLVFDHDQNAYFRSSDALSHGAVLNSRDLISAVEETKADDLDSSNASDGPWLAGKDYSTESFRPEHRPPSQLGVTCIFYDENRQLRS
jgi:hypothetical protein